MLDTKNIFKLVVLVFLVPLLFTACEEKTSSQDTNKEQSSQERSTAPKIEVVHNDNAQEIKVKEKEKDETQSKSYYYDYNIKSKYDQNARPANQDASVRVKPRSNVDANMNIRSPYEKVQISMAVKRLSKNFMVKCSACHNDYANGVIGPSLLGKTPEYIFDKIAQYKNDSSKNILMYELVKQMKDKEIKELAQEIHNFNEEIKQLRK